MKGDHVRRRTLITGAAAATAGGALIGARPAAAATTYHVATTEQSSNRVLVFGNNDANWTDGTIVWQWSAPGSASWTNLSDVRRRSTANWADVVLVAASGNAPSGGRAAMIDQAGGTIIWSAVVPGNPHAVERIKGHGAIVVASSRKPVQGGSFADGGGLALFVPGSHGGKPGTSYTNAIKVDFEGAHGVVWDTTHNLLLAIGKNQLRAYRLELNGNDIITGLHQVATETFGGTGHDLQPDYSSGKLFYTVGGTGADRGVWQTQLSSDDAGTYSFTSSRIHTWEYVKSFSRLPDGKSFWVDAPSASVWWSDTVGFADGAGGKRAGAKFYKARYWTTSFL
jgi:hypothetical protein